MKRIKKLVDRINDEIIDAKNYAELYIEEKVNSNDPTIVSRYLEMAEDELRHSNYLHMIAEMEIDKLKNVYIPSGEMMEKWNKAHSKYVEKSEIVKRMLSM